MEKGLRKTLLCLGLFILATYSFGQGYTVEGNVNYHTNNLPIEEVIALLIDSEGNAAATAITDPTGHYEFYNIPAGTYTVTFTTEIEAGGVSLTDAYLVLYHIYGYYPLDAFRQKVADVDASGSVTYNDYYFIVFNYLNQGIPFPAGDWIFESLEEIVVPCPNRDGFITKGGSVGDVNGTFQPPKYGNCYLDETLAHTEVSDISESATISLEAGMEIDIAGMHLEFKIPEGVTVKKITSSIPGLYTFNDGDRIRATWLNDDPSVIIINNQREQGDPQKIHLKTIHVSEGSPLIELEVEANSSAIPGEEMHFRIDYNSHFIGSDGEMLPYVNLSLPGIKFEKASTLAVKQNAYPNPFLTQTHLEYELEIPSTVTVIVTNNAGQVIDVVTDEYQEAGPHQIILDGTNWPSGIYHYTLKLTNDKTTYLNGSMIKSK